MKPKRPNVQTLERLNVQLAELIGRTAPFGPHAALFLAAKWIDQHELTVTVDGVEKPAGWEMLKDVVPELK